MWLALIDWSAVLGEELVRYNWLVGKLVIPPCVCRKSIHNTTGKRIFLVTTSYIWNVFSSIAINSEVIPSKIRCLSSAPETENCIDWSGGTKDNDQYSCSSKRLIEEPLSIKNVIGLWSKVPDTRHWHKALVLTWNIKPSNLILVVGLIGRWKCWSWSCRRSISWVSESASLKWCFRFAKVTASSYSWVCWIRSACFNLGLSPKM